MTRPLARILIADAHAVVRRGIKVLVEAQGCYHVVAEAADGHEALRLAKETGPSIAILDFSLPQLNGVELTHQIRRACPRTEILIYTHHHQEDIVLEALRAGARGFILKDEPDHQIVAALESLSLRRAFFSERVSEVLLEQILQTDPEVVQGGLTHRERQVVQLIAEGRSNKQVGFRLGISVKTVETHRASVMHKLNLRTTADLVRYAIRHRIILP